MAAADPLPAYRFHRRFLQHRQHRMPPRRWVCKGVMHQFCLDQLWTVYPDALCVWTHRDPAEMIASTLGIYTVLYDAVTGGIDRPAQAARMIDSMRAGYDHLLAQPWLDDPRIVHVRFQDLIAEPVDTVRRVYDRAGLPFSSEQETRIRHWLQANRADRHGKFRYTLDGYGVTAQALRSRFADYAARFLG